MIATLLAGLALPISTQMQLRRQDESRRTLEEARDAAGFRCGDGAIALPGDGREPRRRGLRAGGRCRQRPLRDLP